MKFFILLLGGLYLMIKPMELKRGEKNNNPGNIRHSSSAWQGKSATQTDSEFVQFVNPEWGIRALILTLNTYWKKYGLRNIHDIIYRWAPPQDNNDTEAYIASVSHYSGIPPTKLLTKADLVKIVKGIIRQEQGRIIYSDNTINAAVKMSGDVWG